MLLEHNRIYTKCENELRKVRGITQEVARKAPELNSEHEIQYIAFWTRGRANRHGTVRLTARGRAGLTRGRAM